MGITQEILKAEHQGLRSDNRKLRVVQQLDAS
jgi:hypothetical protein